MLSIVIPKLRLYDENAEEFVYLPEVALKLEHSLLSVRRWESKWQKSYINTAGTGMTLEENMDYVRCMCLDQNVDVKLLRRLTRKNYEDIQTYINLPMTATTFRETKQRGSQKTITAEIIYYMMLQYGIPFECEKWHLNQLFTLIRVCSVRNSTKKQSDAETAAMYRALSEARRKKTGSHG
jgi:hypothetical protein